ncbi:glycosyltransferase family 2 protein [Roseateles koreensis]|uniref:Glycosyltransferase family 2 protein n=1 Tax=Roseateles koreensis TaxID=2987526 RepID=A0ABT5KMK5_9BURK|nr:glycosyltransferase family 2 protein [Roseateles koreensis]MDC8784104.1 glycosyltransferase family 2 protein [Roseateles koreensis]
MKKLVFKKNIVDYLDAPTATPASTRLTGGRRLHDPTTENSMPCITVITVVFNGGDQLKSTIESVLALQRTDIEYVIVDGGSSDNTVDILRMYDSRLDYWVSEPDAGIYDAMNKGITLARGRFVYHLNIGDKLLAIPTQLSNDVPDDVACIAGQVRINHGKIHIPSIGFSLKLHNTLHHQGCFYRRNSQLRYDLTYRVFSDFDLNQRLVKAGQTVLICQDIVAIHDEGGISHTTKRFSEVFQIIRKNEGVIWVALSYSYFKLRGLRHRLIGT